MTKEEILIKNNCLSVKTSDDIFYNTYVPHVHIDNMRGAMSEYAKQEAIAFAEFIRVVASNPPFLTDTWYCHDNNGKEMTTEELYSLYLQSKEK